MKGEEGSGSNKLSNEQPKLKPESKLLLQQLVADANEHGLVLFVGAGINAGALDQWDGLLDKLLAQAISSAAFEDHRIETHAQQLLKWLKANYDVCARASIAKRILGPERYRLEIQDALYGSHPNVEERVKAYCRPDNKDHPKEKRDLELLRVVANLSALPQVRAVVTFNFDTLLECAISALGKRRPCAYFGQVAEPEGSGLVRREIPIYHVHGLLSPPHTLLRNQAESVVLSYDEYFDKNADPLSWETSTPLHFIRDYCTLWLGVSLRDWNMLRLLDSASSGRRNGYSYCLQCLQDVSSLGRKRQGADQQEMREIAMRFQSTLLGAVGMRLIVAGSKYGHIPAVIDEFIAKPLTRA